MARLRHRKGTSPIATVWGLVLCAVVTIVVLQGTNVDLPLPPATADAATGENVSEPAAPIDDVDVVSLERIRNGQEALLLLAQVQVIPQRPSVPGYERSCSPGAGCVFGQRWADVTRSGCDTRNEILARDLHAVTFREGTRECVVESGILVDPYTGHSIVFVRGPDTSNAVHIDHIRALSDAWHHGASAWTLEERTLFANDPDNLWAVDGPTNMAKGDRGPGQWSPVNFDGACRFVLAWVEVSVKWNLSVTLEDHEAITHTAQSCAAS